jgi:hypothetical protein
METPLTVGLIGFLIASVTAIHLHLTGGTPDPVPVPMTDDVDAEFFRIVDREWNQDIHQPW